MLPPLRTVFCVSMNVTVNTYETAVAGIALTSSTNEVTGLSGVHLIIAILFELEEPAQPTLAPNTSLVRVLYITGRIYNSAAAVIIKA